MHPLKWQHLYIPVVPETMHECVGIPWPLLAGINANVRRQVLAELRSANIDMPVVVDMDTGRVTVCCAAKTLFSAAVVEAHTFNRNTLPPMHFTILVPRAQRRPAAFIATPRRSAVYIAHQCCQGGCRCITP